MNSSLRKTLNELGCWVVSETEQGVIDGNKKPFLVIMEESEGPDRLEFATISRLIPHLSSRHGSKPGTLGDRDAPTVRLKKTNGQWYFAQPEHIPSVTWTRITNLDELFKKV